MCLFRWFLALALVIAGCSVKPNSSQESGSGGISNEQISNLKSEVEAAEKALDTFGIAFKSSESQRTSGPYWNQTTSTYYEVRFSSNPELADPKIDRAGIFEACKKYYRLSGMLLKNSSGLSERQMADLSLKQNLIFQFSFPMARIEMESKSEGLDHMLAEYGLLISPDATEFNLNKSKEGADFTALKSRVKDAEQRLFDALDLMPIDLLYRKSFESDSKPSNPWDHPLSSYYFDRYKDLTPKPKPLTFAEKHSQFVKGSFQEAARAKMRLIDQLLTKLGDNVTVEEVRSAVDSISVSARKDRLERDKRHFADEVTALATSAGVSLTTDSSGALVVDREARKKYLRAHRFEDNFGKLADSSEERVEGVAKLGEALSRELRKENPLSEEAAQIDLKIALLREFIKEK